MPIRIPLPARVDDDPELIEHPIYGRAVPRDVPSFVEARAPGVAPETVVFYWPDGAEAVWDSGIRGGFSMPRLPPRAPRLPQTIREAEMEYEIAVAFGVPEGVARNELESHVERIREKRAECQADGKTAAYDVFMPPRDIAERFCIPCERLRKRLERWRRANMLAEGSYIENPDALPNQARYCYNLRAVEPIIRELQGKHAKRPANVQRTDR